MVTVECKTQDEADAAAARGDVIVWRAGHLVAYGSASVYARGSASVVAYDSASVYARGSASVVARDSANVVARGSARVVAYGSARVDARDSARVYAYGSASVYAYNSASVYAHGSASVYAYGSARVYAYGSANVYEGTTSSPLRRDRPRIVIGPLGSRNATLGASIPADGSDPIIYAGCWTGSLTEFAKRVHEVYPDGQFGAEYRAAIAFIRAITEGRQ